jgi:hypothetical protein
MGLNEDQISNLWNKIKPNLQSEDIGLQMEMMLGQTQFILNTCFTKKEGEANSYDPIMIQMSLSHSTIDSNKLPSNKGYMITKKKIKVPLFCLIPMNSCTILK